MSEFGFGDTSRGVVTALEDPLGFLRLVVWELPVLLEGPIPDRRMVDSGSLGGFSDRLAACRVETTEAVGFTRDAD